MSSTEDVQLEALTRQFEEDRGRILRNLSLPAGLRQAKVNALWRKYDAQRTELQEAMNQREARADTSPLNSIFHRPRRPSWK